MKGIVCEQPEQFKMVQLEKPSLHAGHALVSIQRIGICGTDLHAYKGNQPYFTYPRVLGHELSGVIEEIADNENGIGKGDQVSIIPYIECGQCIACRKGKTNCCTNMKVLGVHMDGGMREVISIPIDHLIKTEGLGLDEAALMEPLAIGAHAVRRAEQLKGEKVLVIGAGPIGLGVMAFAKHAGATVIAMDMNEERLQFCQKWANVDYIVKAGEAAEEEIATITEGDYPTVVFDATGNVHSMNNSFTYVAHGGELIYVGLVKNNISFSDPDFHKKEITLKGSRNATKEDFYHVQQFLLEGKVDLSAYITHRASFDEMIEQFDGWLNPDSKVIKAIVELN